MGLAPIMGFAIGLFGLLLLGLAGGRGRPLRAITAGSRADLNGESPLSPSLVRPGSLDYAGLRGEGSIPVPLPPPALLILRFPKSEARGTT
jgi:hypothetical protein